MPSRVSTGPPTLTGKFLCLFWHNDCYRMRTEANEPVSAIDRRARAQISALVEYVRRIREK